MKITHFVHMTCYKKFVGADISVVGLLDTL